MSNNKQLAIIIPAYKKTFLKETLDSIAAQTCQDFTLYIGDDCSPHDLENIVKLYRHKIDLIYKRFDTNLGGKDLVSQWERCINLSRQEPYIWLFSDDDIMEPECVEHFINLPQDIKDNYLIHFNTKVFTKEANEIIITENVFPRTLTAKQYLDGKLFRKDLKYLNSYVVEFIFSRKVYKEIDGFLNFDLAWGSDFLTWVKIAGNCKGIYTINTNNSFVRWRKSNENISPNKSHSIMTRKLNSLIENAKYIQEWLDVKGYKKTFWYSKFFWGELNRNKYIFSFKEIYSYYIIYIHKIGYPIWASFLFLTIIVKRLFSTYFRSN